MPETVIAGRYELEQLLGRGGMSEVYRAQDRELGRRVALKLLAPDADTARFEREARAVAALSHPNILAIHDFGSDDGIFFVVTELLQGRTLRDEMRTPMSPARITSSGLATSRPGSVTARRCSSILMRAGD